MTEIVESGHDEAAVQAAIEAAATVAHQVDQSIRATVRAMKGMWIDLAGDLYRFNRSGMWRDLGHDTFEDYLADPELELRRRWVYELIGMYEQLVIDRDVKPDTLKALNVSKVREVLPAVRRGRVTLEQAFADAEQLTRHDLEQRYRGLASSPEPPIDATSEPVTRGPTPDIPAASSEASMTTERVTCPQCGGRGTVPS